MNTLWTENDRDFLTAMRVKADVEPLEQYDGGTEKDKREEYWLTLFYAVFILASAFGAAALLNAWLPVPGVF